MISFRRTCNHRIYLCCFLTVFAEAWHLDPAISGEQSVVSSIYACTTLRPMSPRRLPHVPRPEARAAPRSPRIPAILCALGSWILVETDPPIGHRAQELTRLPVRDARERGVPRRADVQRASRVCTRLRNKIPCAVSPPCIVISGRGTCRRDVNLRDCRTISPTTSIRALAAPGQTVGRHVSCGTNVHAGLCAPAMSATLFVILAVHVLVHFAMRIYPSAAAVDRVEEGHPSGSLRRKEAAVHSPRAKLAIRT
jgi:hypothetical protein